MSDIFLSYSSKDRDRVAPIHEKLTALGYDVFWDQTVPAGRDWDTWIREELTKARCAVVIWSHNSVASSNVRHEATVAQGSGKLIPLLMDTLSPDRFPMGLYSIQAANLSGSDLAPEWQKLLTEIEHKIKPHAPLWMQNHVSALDANLTSERAKLKSAEQRIRMLEEKIAHDAQSVLNADRERARANDEVGTVRTKLAEVTRAKEAAEEQGKAIQLRLAQVEAERVRLAERLGAGADRTGKVRGSRGHVGLLDVLFGLLACGAILGSVSTASSPEATQVALLVAAGVIGFWSLVTLVRLMLRRRITDVTVTTQPAPQA